MESYVDLSRRRIWLGLSLPGKLMVELCDAAALQPLFRTKRYLLEAHQGPAWKGLLCAATCLHYLADEDEDFRQRLLVDTRDFLMLRFNATGLVDVPDETLLEHMTSGTLPAGVTAASPELAVDYVVSALDLLAADDRTAGDMDLLRATCDALRDLCSDVAGLLIKDQYGTEEWAEIKPSWDTAVDWLEAA